MSLLLWKAPVVREADEAERLLKPYYDSGDESAFTPSADIATVAAELLRRFPDVEDRPWSELPPGDAERVLHLGIRWKADDAVIDAITELAREHQLVLYDPQGPDVHLPDDPIEESGPTPPPSVTDYLKFVLMGLAAAAVFLLGWWIKVPVLRWVLMIGGGFFFSVVVFLLYILLFEPKDEPAGK